MGNKNWKDHVKVGTFFLIISILFVGGILPYITNWLDAGNLSIIVDNGQSEPTARRNRATSPL